MRAALIILLFATLAACKKDPIQTPTVAPPKEWAVIEKTIAISQSEEVSMLVLPQEIYGVFDVRCLIYRNREFNQVRLQCPDAMQHDVNEEPEASD